MIRQGFSWSDAQFLPVAFPRLQRLHLSRNRIASLPIESERLQRWGGLQLLILENNLIETWSGVAQLAPLPSLVRLSLCGNPVSGTRHCRRIPPTHLHRHLVLMYAFHCRFYACFTLRVLRPLFARAQRLPHLQVRAADFRSSLALPCLNRHFLQLVNCKFVEQLAEFEGSAVQVVPSRRVHHRFMPISPTPPSFLTWH
jgi:hypothetical protein